MSATIIVLHGFGDVALTCFGDVAERRQMRNKKEHFSLRLFNVRIQIGGP